MVNTSPPMNSKLHTRTRSGYTGIRYTADVPVKGVGSNPDKLWSQFFPGNLPFATNSLRTLFEETSGKKDGNTRNTWNDFEHYKVIGEFPTRPYTYWTKFNGSTAGWTFEYDDPGMCWPTSCEFGSQDNPTVGLPLLYLKNNVTGNFVPEVSGINTLINSAVRSMLGSVRPEVSLINSLIELKDFRKLPDTINRIKTTVKLIKDEIKPIVGNLAYVNWKSKRTLMSILGSMADAFLQQEFNVKPLISDVEGIRSSLNDLHQRLLKKMIDEGVRRRRDFNTSLPGFADSFKESAIVACPENAFNGTAKEPRFILGGSSVLRQVRYQRARFHAQIEYSHYWSEYQRQNALVLALLDKLGVNFNPAIIWNAIPWSFVVDWVVNVSSFLNQLRVSNTEPVTIVHKFCWSQNISRTLTAVLTPQRQFESQFRGASRMAAFITESSYKRSTQRLNVLASLSGTGISFKEFILGSALKLSRQR